MKTALVLLVVLLGLAFAERDLSSYSFDEYVEEFGKEYSTAEWFVRKEIFMKNLDTIINHNAQGRSWKMGVNKFTDQTEEEMSFYKGYKKGSAYSKRLGEVRMLDDLNVLADLPDAVDWREQGIFTAVKDQGQCGSCWAFASTETIEAYLTMSTGVMADLSIQNLVSCVENPDHCGGTGGCEGATGELAFDYVIENGIADEWTYAYTSYYGETGECAESITPLVTMDGYKSLGTNSYTDLMNTVANVGPVAVSVDASTWALYASGVFDGCDNDSPDLDHLVQVVGYGDGYWIVRNSWGPRWGEDGYIRIKKYDGDSTPCGVDTTPLDGDGCEGGPANVTVCGNCGILYDGLYPTGVTWA